MSQGQGQGANTARKEDAFAGVFWMNLKVQQKSPFRYHHFDINAGCGYNHEAQCDGSPLVFLETIRRVGVSNYAAHFVDRDRLAIEELLTRIDDDRCTVYNGDNREFVKAIPDLIRLQGENPAKALGSVVCDPNGTDLPVDELSDLSHACPRLDFILNYPARTWKRERGAGLESAKLFLQEMLDMLNKKQWWIQCPLVSDPHEWMILIGRNFTGMDGEWAKMRIYKLESLQGQECLRRSLSRRESTDRLF